jgi:hypothetical protein
MLEIGLAAPLAALAAPETPPKTPVITPCTANFRTVVLKNTMFV